MTGLEHIAKAMSDIDIAMDAESLERCADGRRSLWAATIAMQAGGHADMTQTPDCPRFLTEFLSGSHGDKVKLLSTAGALIAAEIERVQQAGRV